MYNQQYDLRVQWLHNRIFHQFSVDTAINSINSMDVNGFFHHLGDLLSGTPWYAGWWLTYPSEKYESQLG